jgi:Cu/Ag efflux pump CusA
MHNIENSQNTLSNLLAKVQDNAARSADFLVPTNQAQFKTEEGKSQIILEANEGLPTTQLRVNNVAFNQIANKAGIDVRTASRLRDGYATEFDGLINAIWEKGKQLECFALSWTPSKLKASAVLLFLTSLKLSITTTY